MKLKLIVSSLFALGVMSVHPLAFGAAKDLNSATAPADAGLSEGRRQSRQPELFVADADQQVEPEESGRGVEDAHFRGAHDHAGSRRRATTDTGQQTSALVIDGVIYIDTPVGGVAAIDGKTGAVKWKWTPSTAGERLQPVGHASWRLGR